MVCQKPFNYVLKVNILFFPCSSKCISYYQWHFNWQLMRICVPFILPYGYRISHPSHGLHQVPEPWWRLCPYSSYCYCKLLTQWYFLIFLILLILRGLCFPQYSFPWVLDFLVFLGCCGSILIFLFSFLFSSKPVFSITTHSYTHGITEC